MQEHATYQENINVFSWHPTLNFSDLPCFLMTTSVRFLTGYLQLGPGVPDFQDFLCFYVLAELTGNNNAITTMHVEKLVKITPAESNPHRVIATAEGSKSKFVK
jgi:hypothetical protein